MVKREIKILLAIFFIALAFRLFFVFQTGGFSDDDSYFVLRGVEHIDQTGKPMLNDPLSYGGRAYVGIPIYHYLLAFFSLFLPLVLVGKIIPCIFASGLVFVVYLLAKEITKNKEAALFTAFVAGFVPIFLKITLNSASAFSFTLPLMFLTIYFFLRISKGRRDSIYFLVLFLVLSLTTGLAFLFIATVLFYVLLAWLENLNVKRAEVEIALSSSLFLIWSQFIIYKKVFLTEGLGIIWGNIPLGILTQYFMRFNLWEAIINIGIVPFICGIYIIYRYVFKIKNKEVLFFAAFAFSIFLLLWLRMIQISIGLTFLGIVLVILFSYYYDAFFAYIERTKFSQHRNLFFAAFVVLFIITSVLPSIGVAQGNIGHAYTESEISAFNWLKQNTPEDTTVAATYEEGNLVTYISQRKNIIDSNFLFADSVDQRLNDTRAIYTDLLETDAVSILNKYNATYIVLSDRAREQFGIRDIRYAKDVNCFDLVYSNRTKIYHAFCKREEVKIDI